jgi:hypothetical protein
MADTLRGMKGIFTDMRRSPEKLLEAEEKIIPLQLEFAIATCRQRHNPYAFLPLHRGSDGFISLANFERFYWPQLKREILALIEAGITPFVLWEGACDFGIMKWPTSAVCFGPPLDTANFYSGCKRELGSGGGSWTGEPRWSCSSRFGWSMSSG